MHKSANGIEHEYIENPQSITSSMAHLEHNLFWINDKPFGLQLTSHSESGFWHEMKVLLQGNMNKPLATAACLSIPDNLLLKNIIPGLESKASFRHPDRCGIKSPRTLRTLSTQLC
jgi:hypothetical protein